MLSPEWPSRPPPPRLGQADAEVEEALSGGGGHNFLKIGIPFGLDRQPVFPGRKRMKADEDGLVPISGTRDYFVRSVHGDVVRLHRIVAQKANTGCFSCEPLARALPVPVPAGNARRPHPDGSGGL